jgi:nitroreductase
LPGANPQPWPFVVVETEARIREAAEREERLRYEERATEGYLRAIEPIGTNASKPPAPDGHRALADGLPPGDRRPAANERPLLLIPVGDPAPGAEVPSRSKKQRDEFALFVESQPWTGPRPPCPLPPRPLPPRPVPGTVTRA